MVVVVIVVMMVQLLLLLVVVAGGEEHACTFCVDSRCLINGRGREGGRASERATGEKTGSGRGGGRGIRLAAVLAFEVLTGRDMLVPHHGQV
eukprot:3188023-Rhodomonas_salina.3